MNIFSRAWGWINKMLFGIKTIEQALGVQVQIDTDLKANQERWKSIYEGKAPWNDEDTPSLQLARSICREVARYVAFELESGIEGSARADYLNEQYLNMLDENMANIERLTGFGSLIFKPYVRGKRVLINAVTPDCYFPLAYNEMRELVSVVFADIIQKGKWYYTLFETHTWDEAKQQHTICYRAFKSERKGEPGREISLLLVEEWAELVPEMHFFNMERPLFVECAMPDRQAIFAKAVDIIKEGDKQLGRTIWEYFGGELAIDADIDVLKPTQDGAGSLPEGKERLYRGLNFADPEKPLLKEWAPTFRDESLFNGLNQFKRAIEFIIGFAYGIISDPNDTDKTAEEIRSSKHRFFVMVQGIQKIIKKAYEEVIYSMDALATLYKLAPVGSYEFTFNPGDGIMEDFDKEYTRLVGLGDRGWIKPEVVVAYARGITEEQALEQMPELEKVIE